MTIVAALMTVFFIMQLVGQVPAALWVIFGEDRFRWSATMIGLSLAVFGILHALAQAFVTGPATKRFGEKQAIIAGGRRAGLRLAGVRDARLDGLPHYDSSRFRRHRDARVAGHAVQAGR
jgi:DHA1 family tetracycline resistance protein-like MFS transporter